MKLFVDVCQDFWKETFLLGFLGLYCFWRECAIRVLVKKKLLFEGLPEANQHSAIGTQHVKTFTVLLLFDRSAFSKFKAFIATSRGDLLLLNYA